jgi:hypothetical protein
MKDEARAAVAAIVRAAVTGRSISSIFDYDAGKYRTFSGTASGSVNLYDYDRGVYVTGSLHSLYDYGHGEYISLKIEGNHFSGFDYGSRNNFTGTLSGNMVEIYDFDTGQHYQYG